jgi:hypothetical protein
MYEGFTHDQATELTRMLAEWQEFLAGDQEDYETCVREEQYARNDLIFREGKTREAGETIKATQIKIEEIKLDLARLKEVSA